MDADNYPLQLTNYGHRVFTCVNEEYLARDTSLDFVQDNMLILRQKLCYEI